MIKSKVSGLKINCLAATSLALVSLGLFPAANLSAEDKIVAIVNTDVITRRNLDEFISFMRMQIATEYKGRQLESKIQTMKLDLLDRLIEDSLILQEAKKEKITVDENRIKARVEEMGKDYPSETEFQKALAKQGLSRADLETKIREQALMYNIIDQKIRSKIIVNPTEVTSFYQGNIEQFRTAQERELESLNINDKKLVKEIFKDLKKSPTDFNIIAGRYPVVLNKFRIKKDGEYRKDIEDTVFKLRINEVSSPLNIDGSYYIFKVTADAPSRKQELTEVQERIYTFLLNKKMQEALVKWIDEIKAHSYIKITQD